MRTITSKGIVIKETPSGEGDKFITVLLKEYGKVTIFCKGARNTKSKFLSSTSVFSYCEFVVFLGAKTPTLASAELIDSFYNIRIDYDCLVVGAYFLEICDKMTMQEENCDDTIRLLYVALNNLIKANAVYDFVKTVFELKLLELMGMYPAHNFCGNCNKEYVEFSNKVFFDNNGILCYNCRQSFNQENIAYNNKYILINDSVIYVLNYIFNTEISKVFNFTISEDTKIKLEQCVSLFINANIDEKFVTKKYMSGKNYESSSSKKY